MQRGSPEHEVWLRNVDPGYKAKADREAKPVPTVAPDVFVTLAAMRGTLTRVASSIAPLIDRIALLEKKLKTLEEKPSGLSIVSEQITIDGLAGMTSAIAMLNRTLALPIKPVYNDKGILVGARRVDELDQKH